MGEEVKEVVASLGYERAQDLVGRYDLLRQVSHERELDLAPLITPLEEYLDLAPADMPVSTEEYVRTEARAEAGLVVSRPVRMEEKAASAQIALLSERVLGGERVHSDFPRPTDADDRVLGTSLAGELSRARIYDGAEAGSENTLAELHFNGGSVAGQGLGAFNAWGVNIRVEGGAQDGVGKTMLGGQISILKGKNKDGRGSTARSASPSPTAPSGAASSSRAQPTRASASASRAPTSSSAASRRRRWTTAADCSPTAPTRRASPSST